MHESVAFGRREIDALLGSVRPAVSMADVPLGAPIADAIMLATTDPRRYVAANAKELRAYGVDAPVEGLHVALKDVLRLRLGFGAAPLGNVFRAIPKDEALATVEAAWNDGIRYFDNAPFYGAGLAEIRMGEALAGKPRDEYVISTKVGRIVLDEVETSARDNGEKGAVFAHGRPNKVINDYSADATLRSIEDSLKRLRTDRIEITRSRCSV